MLIFVLAGSQPGCVQNTGSNQPSVSYGSDVSSVFKAFAMLSRSVLPVTTSGQSGCSSMSLVLRVFGMMIRARSMHVLSG